MTGPGPGNSSGDDDRREPTETDPPADADDTRSDANDTRSDAVEAAPNGSNEPRDGRPTDAESSRTGPNRTDSSRRPPPASGDGSERVTIEDDGVVRWFLKSDDGTVVAVRDVLSSVAVVALIGLILFALSGIWPPLVAVESGSMEPNMERGDLIFIADEDRFVGDGSVDGTGIVTAESGEQSGYDKFSNYGDVIIFAPNGNEFQTPIIHRAHFWVEEGENWVDTKANPDYLNGATCEQVETCPAHHDGFVTKGDANRGYDQHVHGASTDIVRPEWVTGKGMFRIPWLGYVRLTFDEVLAGMLVDSPALPDGMNGGPSGVPVALVGVASAVAIVGGRRPGHW